MFERSFYLRIGDDFICIGEPSIGNGPTTLIVAACVAALDVRQGARAFISSERIAIGGLLFDLGACQTWRAPPWPKLPSPTMLHATCAHIARRAAIASPADSLARAAFGTADKSFARLARPRVAAFETWITSALAAMHSLADETVAERPAPSLPPRAERAAGRVASEASRVGGTSLLFAPSVELQEPPTPDASPPRFARGEGNLEASACVGAVADLVGLGPGLTPSGDDFLVGALAALDALGQTNIRAVLGRAVVAAADRTSPLSASLLRAAAAGHVSENLHTMVAALVTGDAGAAMATAARIGHTSGFDALAGAVVTGRSLYRC